MTSELQTIPNVGPAVAPKLERLDIAAVNDLRGRDGEELFERLCALDATRHDPCLLDTFVAADVSRGADSSAALALMGSSQERGRDAGGHDLRQVRSVGPVAKGAISAHLAPGSSIPAGPASADEA